MEGAPLTLAHSHARTAARETQLSNNVAAIHEHELAAEHFSKASKSSSNSEALRILKLLEDEHTKLAHILKLRSTRPTASAVSEDDPTAFETPPPAATAAVSDLNSTSTRHISTRTSTSGSVRKAAGRDFSSSIASNLASVRGRPSPNQKRGVPSLPELSVHNAGGRVYRPADRVDEGTKGTLSSIPPSAEAGAEGEAETSTVQTLAGTPSDERFERFFSSFGHLFSKISPALAFAALPLDPPKAGQQVQGLAAPTPHAQSQRTRNVARTQDTTRTAERDVDLSALISAPALRALRDETGFPVSHESFYVVPPSGGTESYAGILRQRGALPEDGPQAINAPFNGHAENAALPEGHSKQRASHHSAGSNDEFVDARESFGPPSPRNTRDSFNVKARRPVPRSAVSAFGSKKTGEELEGENAALRHMLDTQSHVIEKQGRRLQMWEAQSQSQTAGLMAQSLISSKLPAAGKRSVTTIAATERTPSGRQATKTKMAASSDDPSETPAVASSTTAKIAQLEAKLAEEVAAREELEKSERKTKAENAKLQTVVGKYRERWEVLKQGARERQSKKSAEESPAVAQSTASR